MEEQFYYAAMEKVGFFGFVLQFLAYRTLALFTANFSFTLQYNPAFLRWNFGIFCNVSPKLPRIHVGLQCNTNE